MPNRILRDWTDSEKIDSLTMQGERFFTRLIMKADDYGRYSANIKILKSTLFPLKTDIRETDISRWLTECEKSDLIVLYCVASRDYLQIKNFKQTLRQKNEKYPAPDHENIICLPDAKHLLSISDHETKGNESETKGNISPPDGGDIVSEYEVLEKNLKSVTDFIRNKKPYFIEPYADLWNFFAIKNKMARVKAINSTRKKKLHVRLKENDFDFIRILSKANRSQFILTKGNWFGFDWIIENDSNYLKVLEGSYDTKEFEKVTNTLNEQLLAQ